MIHEKLYLQSFGHNWAIGIESDSEESIIRRHYSFFNHKATNRDLIWIEKNSKPFLGYFWTNKIKLLKAFEGAALFWILNRFPNKFKGRKFGAMIPARKLAIGLMKRIECKTFIVNINFRNINDENVIGRDLTLDFRPEPA
jgi:hypothetical protein